MKSKHVYLMWLSERKYLTSIWNRIKITNTTNINKEKFFGVG